MLHEIGAFFVLSTKMLFKFYVYAFLSRFDSSQREKKTAVSSGALRQAQSKDRHTRFYLHF